MMMMMMMTMMIRCSLSTATRQRKDGERTAVDYCEVATDVPNNNTAPAGARNRLSAWAMPCRCSPLAGATRSAAPNKNSLHEHRPTDEAMGGSRRWSHALCSSADAAPRWSHALCSTEQEFIARAAPYHRGNGRQARQQGCSPKHALGSDKHWS